jgi:DNA invertase Pin-like site-specific DNA recombinase
MKAFSYVRYSTPEQSKGDSLRRQLDLSRAYAERLGLELDDSLKPDRGISAFRGKNKAEGNLGAFLRDVQSGKVPKGSALLVESLDRISREDIESALTSFLNIIQAGVEIHTLSDNQVYRTGHLDVQQLMLSIFVMSRANEESQRKSERVGAAWRNKKANANANANANGAAKPITSKVPLWLSAKKGEAIQVIPERAAIVKEIFRLAAAGLSQRMIARRLNERGVAPFGGANGWRDPYIDRILHNEAVIGTYVPHRRVGNGRVPEGEPIANYFPAVVTQAEWDAIPKRFPRGKVGKTVNNLFTGLVTDATSGLPMSYENKGRGWCFLVADSRRFGGRENPHKVPYVRFEKAFMTFLDQLEWTSIIDVSDSTELKQAEEQIAQLGADVTRTKEQIQKALDLLLEVPSQALKERLAALEAKAAQEQVAHEAASSRLAALRSKHHDMLSHDVVYSELLGATDLETRSRLRQEIRRKVSRIEFVAFHKPFFPRENWNSPDAQPPDNSGNWEQVEYPGDDQTTAIVHFVNGASRIIILIGDSITATGEMPTKTL